MKQTQENKKQAQELQGSGIQPSQAAEVIADAIQAREVVQARSPKVPCDG